MSKRTAPEPKDDFIVTKLHVVDKYCGVTSDDICQRLKKYDKILIFLVPVTA